MRERRWGSGMRTHSSSKRTPLASTDRAAVMGVGGGSIIMGVTDEVEIMT
jgi:hypothetical protein